jgi:flagellar motor switch protein FliG
MTGDAERALSGLRKAAVLTVMLGPEKAAEAIEKSDLEESQVERLAGEVARLDRVDEEVRRAVSRDLEAAAAAEASEVAGMAAAEELLRRALGSEKAAEIIPWVRPRRSARPFASLMQVETSQLLEVLRDEQAAAIAIVLRYLPRKKAGEVLSGLSEELRMEVVTGLVRGGEPYAEALRQMESALVRKAAGLGRREEGEQEREESAQPGPRTLVEILTQSDLTVENAVLEALAEHDPELGEQVRESMFVFDDLPRLEGKAVQIALREVEAADLAMALKGVSDDIRKVVFENLSENAAAGLKEDLESLGPVPKREVYEAREKVVMAVRTLAEEGRIRIRPEEEEQEEMIE